MTLSAQRTSTGIKGFDDILGGGLHRNRLYLLEGMPGSGKTTLAFQFLLEGVRAGESVLYVTLSETEEEIRAVADSHGWSLDGVAIRELMPPESSLEPGEQYTIFHPSEVELSDTTNRLLEDVTRTKPERVVLDSLSELRLLAGNPLRYRRQMLALKRFFAGQRCTVLILDDVASADEDVQVETIAHGAVRLEHTTPAFGVPRRRLCVIKYRGSDFRGGYHDYVIRRGGLSVYPPLVPAATRQERHGERIGSGVPALDALLGGGIERGASTLLRGASGTGKSTIAALFAAAAAARGEHATLLIFEESANRLFARMANLGVDLKKHADAGRIDVTQVDLAALSPGEFAHLMQRAVEAKRSTVVVIDSLNGYLHSMPDDKFILVRLHELLSYLGQQGVATILISGQQGMISGPVTTPVDASYIADTVIMLRYFEAEGEVRHAISVVKMRGGQHERTIREYKLANGRIEVGEPLLDYRGVFTGTPEKKSRR